MEFLIASLAALVLGPAMVVLSRGRSGPWQGMDAFIFVSILGLVGLGLLPHLLEDGGALVLLVMGLGFWLPGWLEHRFTSHASAAHGLALVLGVLALVLHAVVDGAALLGEGEHGHALAMAVLIHRLPVGVTVWWLLRARRAWAVGTLALLGLATVAGYMAGDVLLGSVSAQGMSLFQALLAGSLMHVVVHRSHPRVGVERAPWSQLAGIVLAVAVLMAPAGEEHHHHGGLGEAFLELAGISAPALLIAYIGAGLLFAWAPAAGLAWLGRGGALAQSVRGMTFGLPLPVCSCGVLPLYHSLVRRGVPSAAAFTFLVATPELGIDALILSLPLLGTEFTVARVVMAALLALAVGLVMARVPRRADAAAGAAPAEAPDRWRRVWRTGFVDLVDETGPWILFGLLVAAMLSAKVDLSTLAALPDGLQLPLFAALGLPVYVCASGATPLVAVLIAQGVSPGAALVFLLTGPATNVTTFGILSQLHGRRVAFGFAAVVLGGALVGGFAVNSMALDWSFPTLGRDHHDHLGPVQWVSLAILALLFAASIWRQGVRDFASKVLGHSGGHHHDHDGGGDCCGHDHDEHPAHQVSEHHHGEGSCCSHDHKE